MAGVWSQRLISLLILSIAVAIPIAWITAGYMELPVTEIVGFYVQDGMCSPGEEPFGRHCFSDFSIITELLAAPSFWNTFHNSYLRSGWAFPVIVYVSADWIGGVQFATYVFLIIALVSTLTPALWVAKGNWSGRGPVAILVIGLGAAPILTVLDRGNSLVLVIPAVLAFSIGLFSNNHKLLIAGAVVSTLLKPQMILLIFALIALRRFRDTLYVIVLSLAGIVMSFLIWPGDRLENFNLWLSNLLSYSDYGTGTSHYPTNLSATRSLLALFDLFGFSSIVGDVNREHLANLLMRYSPVPGIVILAIALTVVLLRRNNVDPFTALFLAISLIIIVPGTSWYYYLVLLVPVTALILKDPRGSITAGSTGSSTFQGVLDEGAGIQPRVIRFRSWTILLVITFSFCLWIIPLPGTSLPGGFDGTLGLIQLLWGPVVLVGTLSIPPSILLDTRKTTERPEPPQPGATSNDRLIIG